MNTTETIIRCIIAAILILCGVLIFILPIFYNKN